MVREVKRAPARLQQGWWANLPLILIVPEEPRAEVTGNVLASVNSPSTAAPRMPTPPPQKLGQNSGVWVGLTFCPSLPGG